MAADVELGGGSGLYKRQDLKIGRSHAAILGKSS